MQSSLPIFLVAAAAMAGGCNRHYRQAVDDWYESATRTSRAEPSSLLEAEALTRMATLSPDAQSVQVRDATLSVEPTYASAAHLTCRGFRLQVEPAEGVAQRRVACRDGDAWFLVPDLLEDGSADGPEDEP